MQLVAAVTLTRFLLPADYGLAALATLCSGMTGYFTQLGVNRSIVQKPGLTKDNIRAAFTLGTMTGAIGYAALYLLAPILVRYFREPRLLHVIDVFGLSLIFQAIGMVASGLLRREFRMRDLALCDLFAYLLSTFGIGLPMAISGYGVWALVGSNASQPLIAAIAYFIARPHSVFPTFRRAHYAGIVGFSTRASITTTVEAISGNLDMIVMGRVISPVGIGIYNRCATLSFQPCYNLSMGIVRVFHPTAARAAEKGRNAPLETLVAYERLSMSLMIPLCAMTALIAPTLIPAVFGAQWKSAVPIYRIMCLVSLLDASFHLPAMQLEVFGRFRYKIILQACFAVCLGVGIIVFGPKGGIIAVGIVYAVLQAVRSVGLHFLSAQSLGTATPILMKSWLPGVVCAIITCGVLYPLHQLTANFQGTAAGLAKTAGLMLVAAAVAAFVYRQFYRTIVYRELASLFGTRQHSEAAAVAD